MDSDLHPDTLAVTAGRPARTPGGPLNAPIVPASTYHSDGDLNYGRDGNSGWEAFENALGVMEGGDAVAFASGMAAVTAIFDELPAGAVVVAQRGPYWGVSDQLRERRDRGALELRELEAMTPSALSAVIDGADLVWAETPTNPGLDIVDIAAVSAIAKEHGALLAIDNTFATPMLQNPIALGTDLVMHSVTKFIGGHSDLLLGAVVAADPTWAEKLRSRRARSGATPGALESFLALRGLRSLPVRLARSQATAAELARRLAAHPAVARVRYPGFDDEVAGRQMRGGGAMISFETVGTADDAESVCATCELIVSATSLGGAESSMERRSRYASEVANGVPETLIRFSVGLEHVDDLWRDLEQALDGISS